MADFGIYFFEKRGEIVNNFFENLDIIKILGNFLKIMYENYGFMCEIYKNNISR